MALQQSFSGSLVNCLLSARGARHAAVHTLTSSAALFLGCSLESPSAAALIRLWSGDGRWSDGVSCYSETFKMSQTRMNLKLFLQVLHIESAQVRTRSIIGADIQHFLTLSICETSVCLSLMQHLLSDL